MNNVKTLSVINPFTVGLAGIFIGSIVGFVFIILKLTTVINWAWEWVLSPLFVGVGFATIVLIFIVVTGIFFSLTDKR